MDPSDTSTLHALLAEEWDSRCRLDPLGATWAGDHRRDDRLPGLAPADWEGRLSELRSLARRLSGLDGHGWSADDRLNADVLAHHLARESAELEFRAWTMPLAQVEGFHTTFLELPSIHPLDTREDLETYVARLADFPRSVEGLIASLRLGEAEGRTAPRVVLAGVPAQVAALDASRAEDSPLWAPLVRPRAVTGAQAEALRRSARQALEGAVAPAARRLLQVLAAEVLPAARESMAAARLPDGEAFYAHRIRYHSSLTLGAAEVHERGRAEVARIGAEMDALARGQGHASSADYGAALRADPRQRAAGPEDLLRRAAWIMKRIDGKLPALFGRLPRQPCGLRAMPAAVAEGNTTARYWPGSGDGRAAGHFVVNTSHLEERPLFELEALTLHEALPGHHLQIALQQELRELPPLRRFSDATAYVEGWALYAESLGRELGCYEDPAGDFGRLGYEMWRACRLVVDTGLHALDWSRSGAIAFMETHTALSPLNIRNEVDRYIAWPGQALAYKLGELFLLDLRARAAAALGGGFRLRDLHDAVLSQGALPLTILAGLVDGWVAGGGGKPRGGLDDSISR